MQRVLALLVLVALLVMSLINKLTLDAVAFCVAALAFCLLLP